MIGRGAVAQPWLCADIAREIYGVGHGCEKKERSRIYLKFITLLEQRFAPERRLGRLKHFTRYFSVSFPFGHHLAAAIQNSMSIEEARRRADEFFAGATS
jgi:tRNA-dihydrouridine synthase